MQQYINSGLCEIAELNTFGEYIVIPNDPDFSNQWGLDQTSDMDIDAPEAWDIETGNSNVVVGILDSGTDWDHEDLGVGTDGYQNIWLNPGEDAWTNPSDPSTGNTADDDNNGFLNDWKGWDFFNNNNDARNDKTCSPGKWHGTHVAGVTGAKTHNLTGIAGVAGGFGAEGVKLMTVGIGDCFPSGSILDDAILYAARNGADIIQLSITVGQTSAIDAAFQTAYQTYGVFIDCASGNSSSSTVSYPASNQYVVAVGATTQSDTKAGFSNYGTKLEIAAPGVNIFSTQPGNIYAYSSGTSFAAPHVAGVAALMLSINPSLTPDAILTILQCTSEKVGGYDYNAVSPGRSLELGYGRINAHQAVSLAQSIDYINYTVTGTETWTTDRIILGTLTIERDAELNIAAGVRIQFGPNGSVDIKPGGIPFGSINALPGGKLNLYGTLTGLDAPCSSMWNGVLVESAVVPPFNGQNVVGGELFMDNAVIEHANTGVLAYGKVTAVNNSVFFNNKVNINLKGVFAINDNKSESIITGCDFTFTPPLRDGSTDPVTFVDIEDVYSGLPPEFVNNNFVNTDPAIPTSQKPIAINSVNSKFFTMGNTFNELSRGIWSINTLAGLETNLNIKNNSFIETQSSIRIVGGRFDVIENNTITGTDLTGSVSSSTNFYSIFLIGTSGFTVQYNTITTATYGISIRNSAPNGGEIHFLNIFTDCWRDIDVRGNNANLQIKCNEFNGNHASAINVFSGTSQFPDQGTCAGNDNKDPAGNDFNGGNWHIYSFASFNYNHHNNCTIFGNVQPDPSKVSAIVTLNNCGQCKTFQSCFTSALDIIPDKVPLKARIAMEKAQLRRIERQHDLDEKELLINHLIIFYLKYNQRDKAIAYLEQHSSIAHKKILIGSYIRSGEFTKAAQLISIIPQNNLENQNFVKYHNVLLNLGINDKTIYQINGQQEQDVRDVAGSAACVSANAQSLLKIVFDEDAVIDLPDPDSLLNNNARIATNNELINELTIENKSAKLVNIVPNPFNDQTIIKYYVPKTGHNAEIIVYDIVGTQVKSVTLNKGNNNLVINASDLDNGIYFIKMIVDGEIIANKKIVVLK